MAWKWYCSDRRWIRFRWIEICIVLMEVASQHLSREDWSSEENRWRYRFESLLCVCVCIPVVCVFGVFYSTRCGNGCCSEGGSLIGIKTWDSSRTEPLHCSAPVGSSSHCHLCDWHLRICEVGQICIKGMSLCMIFYGKGRYEVWVSYSDVGSWMISEMYWENVFWKVDGEWCQLICRNPVKGVLWSTVWYCRKVKENEAWEGLCAFHLWDY